MLYGYRVAVQSHKFEKIIIRSFWILDEKSYRLVERKLVVATGGEGGIGTSYPLPFSVQK